MKDIIEGFNLLGGYSIRLIENGFILTYPDHGRTYYPSHRFFEKLSEACHLMTMMLLEEQNQRGKINAKN